MLDVMEDAPNILSAEPRVPRAVLQDTVMDARTPDDFPTHRWGSLVCHHCDQNIWRPAAPPQQ